jgi:hypothetical protein
MLSGEGVLSEKQARERIMIIYGFVQHNVSKSEGEIPSLWKINPARRNSRRLNIQKVLFKLFSFPTPAKLFSGREQEDK